jgi:hypothetical protein
MTRPESLADFAFGVLIIAATPVFVFIGSGLISSYLLAPAPGGLGVWGLALSFVSFLAMCGWRKRHRRVRSSLFPLEVGLAMLCGFAFMIVLVMALWAAGGPR